MLETGTGPVHLGQILIINVVNIKKKFNNFTKAALTSKNGGKIRKNEKKSIFNTLIFLHYEEKALYYTILCDRKLFFFIEYYTNYCE